MNLQKLAKVPLGSYPTPLEEMTNLSARLGKGNLFIKRDDTTGPAFGGNKTRKLEYVFGHMLAEGYTAVVTTGGQQTNHGRATVAAANKLGLRCVLVLTGTAPSELSGNLTLDAIMGAELVFDNGHRQEAVVDTVKRLEEQGEKVYNLNMGGSDTFGVVGYILAVEEMMEQFSTMGIAPKYLICAVGSLGTMVGLRLGAVLYNAPFEVIGVPVIPCDAQWDRDAAELANATSKAHALGITLKPEDFTICFGPQQQPFWGPGYNMPDSLTREYIYLLGQTEGIILDPTYTAKAFRAFVSLLEDGTIPADSSPVFLHTGGAVGIWTKQHLDAMQKELFQQATIREFQPE